MADAIDLDARSSPVTVHSSSAGPCAKVSVRGASVVYDASVILADVSVECAASEVLCLLGRSGCGKTTLLSVVAGLVPLASGDVLVDGVPVSGPGPDRAMVFQEDAVFPWMTVQRNIEYGLRVQRRSREARAGRAAEVLELVGLTGRERLFPRQLSGGMRKRVDLGRALAVEPEILLLDEPYAALDAMTKERLQVDFLEIQRRTRMTSLFVTHDLEEALFLGDRVVVMSANPGRVHRVIDVPFGHPRFPELKRSSEFQERRGQLAEALESAARGGDQGRMA